MKTYIFYEIGDSCRTECLMKNGKFHSTEDAVVVGIAKGKDAEDALKNLKQEYRWIKDYEFDRSVARKVEDAIYI